MPRTLTDAKIRAAKARDRAFKLADGEGLFLLVKPTGSRLWRWRYWLGGKEQLFAIGSYPEMGLADARKAADAARELVREGKNPSAARAAQKQARIEADEARKREAAGTFAKVAEAWFADGALTWAENTKADKRRRLDRQIIPTLGALPMVRVGISELRALIQSCVGQSKWLGVYVRGDLDAIFRFALVRGMCESNPIPTLRGLVQTPPSENKTALQPPQIRKFFEKLRAHRGYPETEPAFRLLALTAARPGEVCAAEWSEIDFDARLWRIPAEKMKSRREHVCPLSAQAVALLTELRAVTGRGRYLFPSRDGESHAETTRLSKPMKSWSLGPRTSPHGWRTTFSTWANERGFRPDAIERQLAHVEGNKVRATYNKALLVDERRAMMQAWADYLSAVEADNVIPLSINRSAS